MSQSLENKRTLKKRVKELKKWNKQHVPPKYKKVIIQENGVKQIKWVKKL